MFFGKIELAMGFQTVRTHLMKKTANHVKDRGRRDQTRKKIRVPARKKFWVSMGTAYRPKSQYADPWSRSEQLEV